MNRDSLNKLVEDQLEVAIDDHNMILAKTTAALKYAIELHSYGAGCCWCGQGWPCPDREALKQIMEAEDE